MADFFFFASILPISFLFSVICIIAIIFKEKIFSLFLVSFSIKESRLNGFLGTQMW